MSETNLMLKGIAAIQQTCIPHVMYFNVKHQMLTIKKASVCVPTWPFTFKGQGLTERVEISTPFQSEIETYLLI